MLAVKIKNDESLDSALKRFKKKCEKSGIMFEMRKRESYEKPSDRKKRKAYAAQKAREKDTKNQET
ncbi:MAG: 30S ribosomal protein S21 [Candidatus Firestonebacteria bacterium]|nr:30S ribosomal protein S21 [Candidatus Firestonebacteria bacterium]